LSCKPSVLIQSGRIDLSAEIAAIEAEAGTRGAMGGLVTFSGYCRDEGGRLKALELEHYPAMATRELAKVAGETCRRWPLFACRAIHRHGLILPGEEIVLVACASAHRQAAFEAATFLMDYLKTRAPFWKREHLADGSIGAWVEAKASDDAAAARWRL
jgi:molybdopterin synthase catalytic subunit